MNSLLRSHQLRRPTPLVFAAVLLVLAFTPLLEAVGADASSVAQTPLTPEAVQARLDDIAKSPMADAELKAKILGAHTNALTWVKLAGEKRAIALEFANARKAAPAQLAEAGREVLPPELVVSTNIALKSLESTLSSAEADLAAANAKLATLRDEPKRRAARLAELTAIIAAAKAAQEGVAAKPEPVAGPDASPDMAAASSLLASARRQAQAAELAAAEAELLYQNESADLVTAQTDRAARVAAALKARVEALRQAVAQRRRVEAEADVAEAERQRQSVPPTKVALPLIERLGKENSDIAAQRAGTNSVAAKIEKSSAALEKIRVEAKTLQEDFASIDRRVQSLEREGRAIDGTTGLLLRKARANLPELRRLSKENSAVQDDLSEAQLATFELQDQRTQLNDIPGRARALLAEAGVPPDRRAEVEKAVTQLLLARRNYLAGLIGDSETHLKTLIDLDLAQRGLMRSAERIASYIDERVLWIRSAPRYSASDFRDLGELFRERFPASGWVALGAFLWEDMLENPVLVLVAGAFFAGLLLLRRRLGAALDAFSAQAAQQRNSSFRPTLSAMLGTLLVSAIFPLLLGFVAWRLLRAETAGFIPTVGDGIVAMALVCMTLEFYRQVCRPNGLGEVHFGWAKHNTRLARTHLRWLIAPMLPLTFVVAAIEGRRQEASVGQFFFILIMGCLALFAHFMLRPGKGLQLFQKGRDSLRRKARLVHLLVVAVPLGLGVAAWLGYYYTTLELSWRFEATVWVALSVSLLNSLVLRWFVLERRRWAMEQLRKRRAAQEEAGKSGKADLLEESPQTDQELSLYKLNAQTRSLIRLFVGLTLIFGLWGIWSGVFPALTAFNRVELWRIDPPAAASPSAAEGEAPAAEIAEPLLQMSDPLGLASTAKPAPAERGVGAVTLADLLWCFAIIALAVAAVKNIPGFLELTILNRLDLQPGMSYAFTTVARYLIGLVGMLMAFASLGLRWSNVQWLAAAMTVGIGFGLQEIFANFVSGLIILFERPIRVGDIVTVGDIDGTVTRINIRATTITDFDRREFVVPNKEFITGKLLNWTLTDPITRVVVPVGVSYGSNVALAEQLLLKVAAGNPHVMKDPAPKAIFWEFGDNSLDFRLYVHIARRQQYLEMLHGLTTGIDREFRLANIEIAFPQRDVHLNTTAPLEVLLSRKPSSAAASVEKPEPPPRS